MSDLSKKVRGASYPIIDLKKAIDHAESLLGAIGKAAASKEDVVSALGYSSVNGKSKRVIAALIQYGLITGRSSEHKLTSLSLQILFPDDESSKQAAIRSAALKPSLFKALIAKYDGDMIPGLLSNILVTSHGINPSSGEEASNVFKSTLEFAGLLDMNGKISAEAGGSSVSHVEHEPYAEPSIPSGNRFETVSNLSQDMMPVAQIAENSPDLNRIEVFIRPGMKAGIYAPADLTIEEKNKLKSIIDLL